MTSYSYLQEDGQSLDDAYASIDEAPEDASTFQRLRRFLGPGLLIAVGYMDPGNWYSPTPHSTSSSFILHLFTQDLIRLASARSTDIAGGSAFNYDLLFMVALSSLIAMYLQSITVRLGAGKGRDLAQARQRR